MRKIIAFLSILIALVCVISCTSSSTPTGVAETYIKYIKSGNFDKAATLFYYDESDPEALEESKELVRSVLNDKVKVEIARNDGIKSYTIGEEIISKDETTATVKSYIFYKNGKSEEMRVKLKCVDGKWYVSSGK